MAKGGRHNASQQNRPVAAVYRGEVSCKGCAESVAELLRRSPLRYRVHYLGPDEDHDVSPELLSHLDLFAWPGGGDDEDSDYLKVAHYGPAIQRYVQSGGRYLGVCLGAFFARGKSDKQSFFELLPPGSYASGERFEDHAQVVTADDAIIQTSYSFGSGSKQGTTDQARWVYFQDGAQFHLADGIEGAQVLGRYTSTNDPSAVIVPYGRGAVGLVGFHPEADQSWYDDEGLKNPEGVKFDIGHDLIQTLASFGNNETGTPTTTAISTGTRTGVATQTGTQSHKTAMAAALAQPSAMEGVPMLAMTLFVMCYGLLRGLL